MRLKNLKSTRLKIKKETEQKLFELLQQTKNITDILAVQKQLTDLQADIESIEGNLKYLTNQVEYSTIHLTFYEKIKLSRRFFSEIYDGLKGGWQVFLYVLTGISYLWVIILIIFLILFGNKLYKKRRSKKLKP